MEHQRCKRTVNASANEARARSCRARTALALGLAAMSLVFAAGCTTLLKNACRTTVVEPHEFCNTKDVAHTAKRNRRLAEEAWAHYRTHFPGLSADYADGYREGFADYLDYGGNGLPPVLPPRKYWGVDCRSAAGQRAAQDWLCGFSDGATAARQSGLRVTATLPTSLSCFGAPSDNAPAADPFQPESVPKPAALPAPPAAEPPADTPHQLPPPPRDVPSPNRPVGYWETVR